MLTFRVLGPLSVTVRGADVPVTSVHQRRLLAALLLRTGRAVPLDTLIDVVWGSEPPRSAVNSLQSYASRLRGLLGAETVAWTGSGYLARVSPATVDAHRFEDLIDRARSAGDAEAVELLDRALALWHDEAYADLPHHQPAVAEAVRLTELRLTGAERRAEALLALGHLDEAVAALRALTVEHPLRERPWPALMLALHRTGRQADALAAFRRYDEVLAEHGLEPAAAVRELRTTILGAPETVRETVPATRGPAQLPAPAAGFTGRRDYLRRLDELLAAGSGLAIMAISGTAGVGKTALAVRWAHQVRDRFGDGQLFADLRGYAAGPPVRPIDALTGFLHALGVPAGQAPVRLEEAGALYRTLVAGRRLMVVLDNARGIEQVRPLLPGDPRCLVIVTSRDRLGGLVARDGALPVRLGALSPGESRDLLAGLLGAGRVAAEPGAAAELAEMCAFLPLALRVAAADLAWHPDRRIGRYLTGLRGDRLATLAVDGDADTAVGRAFDQSYVALPEPARRLFRLVGLVPGPHIDVPAGAALGGLSGPEAARLLGRLADAHLLDQPAPDRYRCHDLLRWYAAERCAREDPAGERDAAAARLYDWYLRRVHAAADELYPHMLRLPRPDGAAEPFDDPAGAVDWLDRERQNLVAAVRQAAERGPRPAAWLLADALRGYFHLRRHASDWLTTAEAALRAARADGDPQAEAAARHSLGTVHRSMGDHREALRQYAQALRLARQCGWREAEATALGNLGIVCGSLGRLRAAAVNLTRALAVDRATGRHAGVANNLGNLGKVYHEMGRLAEAAAHFTEALQLNRDAGGGHGEALALTGLGGACHELGRFPEAVAHLDAAMSLYTRIGDRDGQAVTHHQLAAVACDLGHLQRARDHGREALALARDTGDPRTEADALNVLAGTSRRLGDHAAALDQYREALARKASHRAQIEAFVGLADALWRLGDPEQAGHHAQSALKHAARAGFQVPEGKARAVLAGIELSRGDAAGAEAHARLALAGHRRTGYRLGEACALRVLGDCLSRQGAAAAAERCGRQAGEVFRELGVREADAHAGCTRDARAGCSAGSCA